MREVLVSAAAMRGGPALVGSTTPDVLLARWTAGDDVQLFVGEFAHAVVGLGAVRVEPASDGRRRGRIECCYVEGPARGVGVGSALMEAAVAWCAGRGCTDVDALALPGDRATKQRLEAVGFTTRLLTVTRRLG